MRDCYFTSLLFITGIVFIAMGVGGCKQKPIPEQQLNTPGLLLGTFEDDYGNTYEISDEKWSMGPNYSYSILDWNITSKYFLAKNFTSNPTEPDLYSKFEWIELQEQNPYTWAYCHTIYNADNLVDAVSTGTADRLNPLKGCSGFPFSRMKRTQ